MTNEIKYLPSIGTDINTPGISTNDDKTKFTYISPPRSAKAQFNP